MIKDEVFNFFADYIFKNSGMVYPASDFYRLESRINELVRIYSAKDADEIYRMYKKEITPDMKAVLINISTNNETYFFRDVKPFSILNKIVLPEMYKKFSAGNINIWSAASSTGQEALSISMGAHASLQNTEFLRLKIFASDISHPVIEKAKNGIYSGMDVQRGLPVAMLMKYFSKNEDSWVISKEILNKIKYFEFNLLKDIFPREMYHIVFCRNVLIYQEKENKNTILQNIYNSIIPGGYLFLGNGESLIGVETKFERITLDGHTVFQKNI